MTTTRGRFLFHVAAGPHIGFGHLLRCRALARAMRVRPIVSLRGGVVARRTATALGCRLVDDPARQLDGVDALIVDDPSPEQCAVWIERGRRAETPTASIHDLGAGFGGADLVVDASLAGWNVRASAHALRGPRFAILDPRVEEIGRAHV
jgi:hypothetical protein